MYSRFSKQQHPPQRPSLPVFRMELHLLQPEGVLDVVIQDGTIERLGHASLDGNDRRMGGVWKAVERIQFEPWPLQPRSLCIERCSFQGARLRADGHI